MKRIQRGILLLLSGILLALGLVGCGERTDESEESFTLSAYVCGAMETLDPAQVSGAGEESVLSALFEGLMRMRDDGNGNAVAVAGIAKEYREEQNYDDTVTYTFTLRSTARWSDGVRVKAEDFVYAWQRLVDPATESPNASLLKMVEGYDEVRATGDVSKLGVSAKGDDTLIVTLSAPSAQFLTNVCTAPATAPLRRDLVEGRESWASFATVVTNGAYCVEAWEKDSYLLTKRNTEYYEARLVVPEAIRFSFEGDAASNYEKLLGGEMDYLVELPDEAVAELAQTETWQPTSLAETVCVVYNHLTDAFSEELIRRAFEQTIDRAALAEKLGAAATAADGCVPGGIVNVPDGEEDFRTAGGALCTVSAEDYMSRSEEAARLMTANGHYQGTGLGTLRFLYEESAQNRATVQTLRDGWKSALGVAVEPVGVSAEEFSARLTAGEYELALVTLDARSGDAMEYLLPFRGTAEENVCGYQNDTFDLLIGVAETTGDLNARAAFLHDAEAMLLEDSALSPLYFRSSSALLREEYRGVSRDCFGHSYFTAVHRAETA